MNLKIEQALATGNTAPLTKAEQAEYYQILLSRANVVAPNVVSATTVAPTTLEHATDAEIIFRPSSSLDSCTFERVKLLFIASGKNPWQCRLIVSRNGAESSVYARRDDVTMSAVKPGDFVNIRAEKRQSEGKPAYWNCTAISQHS